MIYLYIFPGVILSSVFLYFCVRQIHYIKPNLLYTFSASTILCYTALFIFRPGNIYLNNAVILLVSLAVGSIIGRLLSSDYGLLAFLIAASVADIVSFTGGFTDKIITNFRSGESDLLLYLAIMVKNSSGLIPVIGIGDLVILTALFFALKRLNYSNILCFLAPLTGLLAALITGIIAGGIPGVPFLAASVMIFIFIQKRKGMNP